MAKPSTYPPFIEALLDELLVAVQAALGHAFVGLYLSGSLALADEYNRGDFNPSRSDIDFVVVTETTLCPETIEALQVLHQRLYASHNPWARRLEGAYISRQAIRCYDPAEPGFPYVNQEHFGVGSLGADWVIHRHILYHYGRVVAGPPPDTLIDPPDRAALRQAVIDGLHTWWLPMLENPYRLLTREYQSYAVLTLCRALFTLDGCAITTKSAAAAWALANLPPRWHDLIQQALDWPAGTQPDRLDETLAFLRFVGERLALYEQSHPT